MKSHDAISPAPATDSTTIPYATPAPMPTTGVRVWAATAILLGGLGLVVLGGCFLIGAMMLVTGGFNSSFIGNNPKPWTVGESILLCVLYLLAFASFLGAVWVILLGIRGLWSILKR